jgi:hypothetical protein
MKFNCLDRFLKNTQISNFMKIQPVVAELFGAYRYKDMRKLTVTSRNFSNVSKNDQNSPADLNGSL